MGQLHGPRCEQPLGYDIHEEYRPTSCNRTIFVKPDHESVTMERGPMTHDNFMVHDVNKPSAMTFMKNANQPALKIHSLKTGP
jgi:hypothetical protein